MSHIDLARVDLPEDEYGHNSMTFSGCERKHSRICAASLVAADLPKNYKAIVTYVGSLWGEWFDWDLVANAAAAMPDTAFLLIGSTSPNIKSKVSSALTNIHFLGLKSQTEIPGYFEVF